jgi:hypothetical protein
MSREAERKGEKIGANLAQVRQYRIDVQTSSNNKSVSLTALSAIFVELKLRTASQRSQNPEGWIWKI